MASKNRKLLFTVLALMLFLRAGDIYITYKITPDLSQEWNPLVSIFGHSWQGLLSVQVVLFSVAAFCVYYSIYNNAFTAYTKGLSYGKFVYFHFNGKIDPPMQWLAKFFKLPQFDSESLSKHFAFICFVYFSTFMTVSLFAIFNNILVYMQVEPYLEFVHKYSNIYILSTFVLSIFINAQIYFYWGYRRYLSV